MQRQCVMLFDASALAFRAFFATQKTSTAYSAIRATYVRMLRFAMNSVMDAQLRETRRLRGGGSSGTREEDEEATQFFGFAALESPVPTFRHSLKADYKANRPPIDPVLGNLLRDLPEIHQDEFDLISLASEGFEADDIIASFCSHTQQLDAALPYSVRSVIVSQDKDFWPLLAPSEDVHGEHPVSIYDPVKRIWVTAAHVEKRTGVPCSWLLDYFALMGDSSDNVPGVRGIGPKRAAKLLHELADAGKYVAGEPLSAESSGLNEEQLLAYQEARQLIELRHDVPDLPPLPTLEAAGEEYVVA